MATRRIAPSQSNVSMLSEHCLPTPIGFRDADSTLGHLDFDRCHRYPGEEGGRHRGEPRMMESA